MLGGLSKGQSVLIHAGASGVGQLLLTTTFCNLDCVLSKHFVSFAHRGCLHMHQLLCCQHHLSIWVSPVCVHIYVCIVHI